MFTANDGICTTELKKMFKIIVLIRVFKGFCIWFLIFVLKLTQIIRKLIYIELKKMKEASIYYFL